jgi:predicted ATP-dependent endonuclease of OLD family
MTLKDLTIIVGKNNAGKSTVIEALRMITTARNKSLTSMYVEPPRSLNLPAITRGFKLNTEKLRIDLRTVVYFYNEEVIAKITAHFSDKSHIEIYMHSEIAFACIYDQFGEQITSRSKAIACNFSNINILPQIGLIKENERKLNHDTVVADKETYLSSRHFRNELVLYRDKYYAEFCSLAETTWPGLRIRDLIYNPNESEFIYFSIEDASFTSEIGLMGSGIQMWLQIIWFICRSKDCDTIILVEPDVYMHPDLQRKLFRFIRRRFKQVVIATHSVEIISEVEAANIIDINKKNRKMAYADSKKGVQSIIDGIGSIHNISLVRIANTKKCLFVEGKDIEILSKLHAKLYPDNDFSMEILPTFSLGGWSRLNEAFGAAKLFHEETDDQIKCYCILDRDYFPSELIQRQYIRAKECNLILHIWYKKEIENYLIVPSVLFRITRLPKNKYDCFCQKLDCLLDTSYKTFVTDKISEQIHTLDKSKAISTCNEEARKYIEQNWTTLDSKINLASGKDLISDINSWLKREYNVSCSLSKILKNLNIDEINQEVKDVIDLLTT